jgi:hypothetical protein
MDNLITALEQRLADAEYGAQHGESWDITRYAGQAEAYRDALALARSQPKCSCEAATECIQKMYRP